VMISPRRASAKFDIRRVRAEGAREVRDTVAVEEPLEIRVRPAGAEETAVAVTMRTPGHDFELAAGFLFSEGLVANRPEIAELSYCADVEPQQYNIVTARLRPGASFNPSMLNRNFYATSSCGVCGKASLEALEMEGCEPIAETGMRVPEGALRGMPEKLRSGQTVFDRTGGLHAAGLFGVAGHSAPSPSSEGPLLLREDVGRHNAVDKVIGRSLMDGRLPLADHVLAVSGRASFEIMQKALNAGIPVVVAVGAPSSLAVDLAREFGMTLAGFASADRINLYSGAGRITR